jgi:hypothetical protein
MVDATQQTQDDPRTRRRRLAEAADQEGQAALEEARAALKDGELPNLTQALEALRKAAVAHQALLLHAQELRSDFTRRASLAMADHLHRDLQVLWDRALLEVHSLDAQVNEGRVEP